MAGRKAPVVQRAGRAGARPTLQEGVTQADSAVPHVRHALRGHLHCQCNFIGELASAEKVGGSTAFLGDRASVPPDEHDSHHDECSDGTTAASHGANRRAHERDERLDGGPKA